MQDKEFLADVAKARFEVTPVSGDKLEQMVLDIYRATVPAVAEKAMAMVK
jgi:hypothetical protein